MSCAKHLRGPYELCCMPPALSESPGSRRFALTSSRHETWVRARACSQSESPLCRLAVDRIMQLAAALATTLNHVNGFIHRRCQLG